MTKIVREYLDTLLRKRRVQIAGWFHDLALRLDPDPELSEPSNVVRPVVQDDPLVDVLHRALGNRTGKLRVSDAFLICGLEPGKVSQDQIERFGRAIRELGWERMRRRFDIGLEYVYVRGTPAERQVDLVVEYDPHTRSVRIEIDKATEAPARDMGMNQAEHGALPFLSDRQRYSLRCLRDFARPRLATAASDDQNRCDRALAWLDDLLDGSGSAQAGGPPDKHGVKHG